MVYFNLSVNMCQGRAGAVLGSGFRVLGSEFGVPSSEF